jgi:HB1, ASXL, restriction endonuclease HTH domain
MASKSTKGKVIVNTLRNVYPPPEEKVEAMPAAAAAEEAPAEAPAKAEPATKAEGKAKTKKAKAEKPKKTSAVDAAAKVLAETGKPMNTKEMIDAMTAKGYWTSPNGLTPHATLYSALLREINSKGGKARFRKADRGQFALV